MEKFIIILLILISYTVIEYVVRKIYPKYNRVQLWTNSFYYVWGLVLIIIMLFSRSNYVFSQQKNLGYGLLMMILTILAVFIFRNKTTYYPKFKETQKCIHYSLILPLFEEIAFRGLLLPISIALFSNVVKIELLIVINAFVFVLFHRNYWSFIKKHMNLYINFFLIGIFLSSLAYYTNTILYSFICHVIINGGNTLYHNLKKKLDIIIKD